MWHGPPKVAGLDLNLVVVLDALLAHGNVTQAAKAVGITQPAASRALGRLRDLYRDPLLVRSGRTMVLTPRAIALKPAVTRALAEIYQGIVGDDAFEPRTTRRTFTLGSADYGFALMCGPLLAKLAEAAPLVTLEMQTAPNLLDMVDAGTFDAALVVQRSDRSGHGSVRLFDDDYLCMVRRDHPKVKSRLDLETYLALEHLVVAPSGSPGSTVDAVLARKGLARHIAMRIPSFLAAPIVVAQSDLVSTGPRKLATMHARHHAIRLVEPPKALDLPGFSLRLAWHHRFDEDPAHRWLRGLVGEVAVKL